MIKWLVEWIAKSKPFQSYYDVVFRDASIDAFVKARNDIEESFQGNIEERAEELAKEKLMAMLSIVDERSIVTFNEQQKAVFIGGVRCEPNQLASLKAEAAYFLHSDLWRILHESPKELAMRAMFVSGESTADMAKGRSMLYTLATQKRIIDTFNSYSKK